jgi:type II protein arginine methyltransferase
VDNRRFAGPRRPSDTMNAELEPLKKLFREGRHAEAIAACEALCQRTPGQPDALRLCANMHLMMRNFARALALLQQVREHEPRNADVLFNIGLCARELQQFDAAAGHLRDYVALFPTHPDGWASLADCELQRHAPTEAAVAADRAIALDPACAPAWTVRARSLQATGQYDEARAAAAQALKFAPAPELHLLRAETFEAQGDLPQAVAAYRAALALAPAHDEALKKATLCLLQLDQADEAIALCQEVIRKNPASITARLGAEWVLSQVVPLWHVPMLNETERNQAYRDGLAAVLTPENTVFEIGTGAGLLAMMAAQLGARRVVTCEAVGLVAQTARRIVARNGLQDRVTVLAKPSYAVRLGEDLPEKADVLVHEIFSSELLGEHVLPAIEDAKARLLKPGGTLLPASASIMVALVGGEALGRELHVDEAFGFDLTPFNAIHARKRPLHREDLPRVLLSDAVEAFRFDFAAQDHFPPERKRIDIAATQAGRCWGLIQWIRFELAPGIVFENHPAKARPVANWQHTVFRFEQPPELAAGTVVRVDASHDRSRPWFELAVKA